MKDTAAGRVRDTARQRVRLPGPSFARWFVTLARLLLGAVWLAAGSVKIGDLDASVRAVRAYRLLPEVLVQVVGAALPLAELLLAVLRVAGLFVRACRDFEWRVGPTLDELTASGTARIV